jgi:titin
VQIASGATSNVIGGTAGAGNVISGNNNTGVVFSGAGTTGNVLRGNRIGVAASSGTALGNAFAGVLITGGASGNEVGGTAAASGNVIARNGTTGVRIEPGAGNKVLRNSIFANGQLGIDIGPAGVTSNNPADGLLNYPDLDVARLTASGLRVRGSINTEANSTVRIEFFANPAADSSGHGEGKRFLGTIDVQTQAGNDVEFSTLLAVSGVKLGQFITATATDELGNTSEFSLAVAVS